ncbi:DUF4852 domain-containing protein [Dysgonomonas sp. GY617]|uniref:DUF4852 domain-containing protein n=1 Tax=Dysgonomonas sp. GY617 TaxID=2780420 RepID=UPI00188420EA|nr:DUF4852 domain-containing protein [Dysgonomonas sp. GY617]MBF0576003.1 DUF4852 domain-containing protein [Dysgonomonas sp. GY617]
MKKIYFILFVLSAIINPCGAQDFIQVYDGDVIKKGDILKAGYCSLGGSEYWYIKEKFTDNYGKDRYQKIKDTDVALSDITVIRFIQPTAPEIFGNTNTVAVAMDKKQSRELFIDIDNAISKGEIVSRFVDHSDNRAIFLSDDLIMACQMRVNGLFVDNAAILEFIQIKDKDLYLKCLSNEFEFNEVKDQYRKTLEDMISTFDFTAEYYIKDKLVIGKYDFDENAYPLSWFDDIQKYFYSYGRCEFILSNPEYGKLLPVTLDEASKSNKRRKGLSAHGYVSTLAYGRIYLKLFDQKMELPKQKYSLLNYENLYRHKVIGAEIRGIEVYDYPQCDYNLIGKI